jgi:hypothetical protein
MSQRIYLAVIAALVIIILLQRSCTNNSKYLPTSKDKIVYDTIWRSVVKTETKKISFIKHDTSYVKGDTIFVADLNYDNLKLQFNNLAKNYGARNIYRDSILLDTLGYITVLDTIQYNKVSSRTYIQNYKLPTVTGYVQAEQRRQLYIGGGISIDKGLGLANLQAGLLYKNKKDQIFGLQTGVSQDLKPYVGFSSYWKIKLK